MIANPKAFSIGFCWFSRCNIIKGKKYLAYEKGFCDRNLVKEQCISQKSGSNQML